MICLTFDTDYMRGDDMESFLRNYPVPGTGTFFLWQPMRGVNWRNHEIQPHPCFFNSQDWERELDSHVEELGIQASGLRAHSCAYSHRLGVALQQRGYRYVSMTTPLFQDGLAAYRHPWGLWELPVYYMDNMDFCLAHNWPEYDHTPFDRSIIDRAVNGSSLYVFDFHPLHVVMNTPDYPSYEDVRPGIVSGDATPSLIDFTGNGTRNYYLDLCEAMEAKGVTSFSCLEALDALNGDAAQSPL